MRKTTVLFTVLTVAVSAAPVVAQAQDAKPSGSVAQAVTRIEADSEEESQSSSRENANPRWSIYSESLYSDNISLEKMSGEAPVYPGKIDITNQQDKGSE